jgi:hypothetical protein
MTKEKEPTTLESLQSTMDDLEFNVSELQSKVR